MYFLCVGLALFD
jgi:hypothetical protein